MTGAQFGEGGGEVDIDLLADYIDGCLTGTADESTVAALVADDPAWRDAYRELSDGMASVGAELARFAPEPMPAELAAGIDALLTAPASAEVAEPDLSLADSAAPPTPHLALVRDPDAVGNEGPVPEKGRSQRGRGAQTGKARRLRWATPIAIAAGVAAFVGFGLDYLLAESDKSADQASTSAESNSRFDAAGGARAAADVRLLNSGTNYTAATLTDAPRAQTLAEPDSSSPVGKQEQPTGGDGLGPLSRLRDRSALQACLDEIQVANSAGEITVESVDFARFAGAPAVVVRFTAANGGRVWASGPSCGTPSRGADTRGSAPVR